ncbi:Coenzyme F420 hydrogenase/dehydrogenase, beta subunit C-terminal domain [Yoonia sp. GPGPB17]|uniref:Coenzyme F420 hydrogenase/dehydrogenase, beta subunit C-terminal domain n=1 Tax=Yoonia sp. GPGPB17 TaxID=3026147 RepID=UPI0030EE1056
MTDPSACGKACQFIKPNYPSSETTVHGRAAQATGDEQFFGVIQTMYRAALTSARAGAQWTGLTTRFAEKLLETGAVDAVLTMVPDETDKWRPRPALITDPADMQYARGMRMGYAPLLALLEPALTAGHRKIAVIGIPCQIYALRAMEANLGFDRIYVIGTPCSDNTTTENFHSFLARLTNAPETVTYLEFRADYHVELRFTDGSQRLIPFLKLPLSELSSDFFPTTCRTCVDYTNRLADITVGYMAGEGDQWLIVRNDRGAEMLKSLGDEVTLAPRIKRQTCWLCQRFHRKHPTGGWRLTFAPDAGLAAGDHGLADAPDWPSWPRIRPRACRNESRRNHPAPAARRTRQDQEHGARARLEPRRALRANTQTG